MQVHYTSPLMLGYAWFLSLILSAFFFLFLKAPSAFSTLMYISYYGNGDVTGGGEG